jgi:hypothetical protein
LRIGNTARENLVAVELTRHAAQAIQATERKAVVVVACVLDRVVHVVQVARVRSIVRRPLATHFERAGVVHRGVVLTTEGDRTVLARQANVGLTAEFVAALTQLARILERGG